MGITTLVVWFVMRGNPRIDYRIVGAASLLPAIVDVPIGRLVLREQFDSGHLYAHTLVVNVAVFCTLFFMRGRAKRQLVLVPIASLLHLAEDAMWSVPEVFWWPLFGSSFPHDPLPDGTLAFMNPANYPGAWWQEPVGLAVMCWLLAAHGMLSRAGVVWIARTGMLSRPKEPT